METPTNAVELDTPKPDTEARKPDDALSLLAPDIEAFYSNIPAFILPLSNIFSSAIQDLRTLASANTDAAGALDVDADMLTPRSNHNARARARDRRVRTSMAPVPLLSSQLQARVRALRQTQLCELPVARRKMAATAANVVTVRAQVLERTVVTLERAKHGALARATKAKAEHLALVAQDVEGKLEYVLLPCCLESCCLVLHCWMWLLTFCAAESRNWRLRLRFIRLKHLLLSLGTGNIFDRRRSAWSTGGRW